MQEHSEKERVLLAFTLQKLFVNRQDDYAIQQTNSQYRRVNQPLTLKIINDHLDGKITVGVYQLNEFNCVGYLCFDVDPETNKDPLETSKQILDVLFEENEEEQPRVWCKAVLLEASRYPDNSYHLWILFDPKIPAKIAKWLGLRILELASLNPKQIEIFPKQTKLTEDNPFGNLIKLPLGFHQVERKWSRFVDLETFEPIPSRCLFDVEGINFREVDIDKILGFQDKKAVQVTFDLPESKTLKNESEAKIIQFLCPYWKEGKRNRIEMAFLGWCLKRGVSRDSALRIVGEVTRLTGDFEANSRIELVEYHYRNRRAIGTKLLGISGLKQIVREAIQ